MQKKGGIQLIVYRDRLIEWEKNRRVNVNISDYSILLTNNIIKLQDKYGCW
jgi:hypothetical protein